MSSTSSSSSPSLRLPSLPSISKEDARAVFAHPSIKKSPKKALRDAEIAQNYRRLAFLGDTILSMVVTDYLYERYRHHRPGVYHAERVKFINNKQLAEWSMEYGLMTKLNYSGSRISDSINVGASVFEAYVAAVYKEGGLSGVKAWLEELIGPRISIEE
ncbi:hypothetical protein FRC03_012555 [Tulasnella sp. 419]|nr:hypothetical protein FRC03_012555 [Tulasnella sp. 419]